MRWDTYPQTHKKDLNSAELRTCGAFGIALVLTGPGWMSLVDTTWPNTGVLVSPNSHFWGFNFRLHSMHFSNTLRKILNNWFIVTAWTMTSSTETSTPFKPKKNFFHNFFEGFTNIA